MNPKKSETKLKKTLPFSIFFLALTITWTNESLASIQAKIDHKREDATFAQNLLDISRRFYFNYFVKYLGPSLSPEMKKGSTFNRFKTGQDARNKENDFRGAHQTFQSFQLGLNITDTINISFAHSFQYDENNKVEYEYIGFDNKRYKAIRQGIETYNDQRVTLRVRNIVNNSHLYLNASTFYEIPSTQFSQDNDMQYGYGFSSFIGIYNNIPGLALGINAIVERDVFPDNEFYPEWCNGPSQCVPIKKQVLFFSYGPWLSYQMKNNFFINASLSFDYDLDGDQIKPLESANFADIEFSPNMNDILSLSLGRTLLKNVFLSIGLEASITVLELERTAMFASMAMTI